VLALVEPLVRYARAYPARVVAQRADLSLDLRLISRTTKLPDPTSVPIRGLPGVTVRVKAGALVLLEFEHGDRARPIATLFGAEGLDELRVTAATRVVVDAPLVDLTPTASRGVAAEGDLLTVTGTGPLGPFTGTAQIATGSARVRV